MIGIAFSGGGARGIAHLGVLKALLEHDINPEIISGTSAGAIVGALYAAGYSPEEALAIIKQTNVLSVFRPSFSWKGLLSIDNLGTLLKNYLPVKFSDLDKELIVAATNINSGKTKYFKKGALIPAILASCCVPLVFKPVRIGSENYVDGGLLKNLPAEVLRKKVDLLIGVNSNPSGQANNLDNARLVMERSALLAIGVNTARSLKKCDIVIEPAEMNKFSGFGLSQAQEIFEYGYDYTQENISNFVPLTKYK